MRKILLYISTIFLTIESFQIKRHSNQLRCNRISPIYLDLKMHMGHSHTHDHYHDISSDAADTPKVSNARNFDQPFLKRSALRILFSAVLVAIPALIRRRMSRVDLFIFGLTIVALNVYDSIRNTIKGWISRLKVFQQKIVKHSSPITREYFFKNENAADRVTLIGVWINIVLSVVKFIGGITFNSAVLVADAGHSLSDLLSDFITLWVVQIARIPPDDDHPYGHGKFEAIGSLFLSIALFATGLSIGLWSYDKMHSIIISQFFSYTQTSILTALTNAAEITKSTTVLPSWPALILAGISILSKEWLFQITKRVGSALNSQMLIANAWHHRSDAFSSILSLASISIAILFPSLLFVDSAGGILVAGMICLTGVEVMVESVKQLTDTLDEELSQQISTTVLDVRGVLGVKNVRARNVGSDSLVDLTILTDHQIPASVAHNIGEDVRWKIIRKFPYVSDVMIRTSAVETYCPLLSKKVKGKSVEDLEKEITSLLNEHEHVKAVRKVKVHHMNTSLLGVEGYIRLNPELTIAEAETVARTLQDDIKERIGIEFAEIQLALAGTDNNLIP